MCGLEQARNTRCANGAAAIYGLAKRHGFAVTHEQFACCTSRCSFPTIVGTYFPICCIVVHQESAAAEAGGVRLNQIKNKLHGDHRINCIAAGIEHLQPGLHRERVCCCNHVTLGVGELFFDSTARRLRLQRPVGLCL